MTIELATIPGGEPVDPSRPESQKGQEALKRAAAQNNIKLNVLLAGEYNITPLEDHSFNHTLSVKTDGTGVYLAVPHSAPANSYQGPTLESLIPQPAGQLVRLPEDASTAFLAIRHRGLICLFACINHI